MVCGIFSCSDQSESLTRTNCINWKATRNEIDKQQKELDKLTASLDKLKKIQGELAIAKNDAKTISDKIGGFNEVWLGVGDF